jgi:cytochrome P450 family 6
MTTVETPILNTELPIFSGMRFGLMQTKVGLVCLLSKYQIRVSKKTPIPIVFDPKSFNLSPLGGMWLQIRKRVE